MIYHKTVGKLEFLLKHLFHPIIFVIGFICWLLPASLPSLMTVDRCVLQLLITGKTLTWPVYAPDARGITLSLRGHLSPAS